MSDKKKLSYKRKAALLEEALEVNEKKLARLTGLLGVAIHIFGEDVMKALTDFNDNPIQENKEAIRDKLELRFMEINNEEGA